MPTVNELNLCFSKFVHAKTMLSAKNNINNNSRRVLGLAKDFVVIVELALRDTDG